MPFLIMLEHSKRNCFITIGMLTVTICDHYSDVTMGSIASQITSLTIVYSSVYSDADQRKHQSSASLAFVRGIHRRPVNSPHKWPVTRKIFPFDDVIMIHVAPGTILQISGSKNREKSKLGTAITHVLYMIHLQSLTHDILLGWSNLMN